METSSKRSFRNPASTAARSSSPVSIKSDSRGQHLPRIGTGSATVAQNSGEPSGVATIGSRRASSTSNASPHASLEGGSPVHSIHGRKGGTPANGIASVGGFKFFYDCGCSVCRRFWRETFGTESERLLGMSSEERTSLTSPLLRLGDRFVKIGDRVIVWGTHHGVIKFFGPLDDKLIAPVIFVGVRLDENVNSISNGIYKGKRYFECPSGHGVFVQVKDVEPLLAPPTRPPLQGNAMFPSYDEVLRRRRVLAEKQPAFDFVKSFKGATSKERAKSLMDKMAQGSWEASLVDKNDIIYKEAEKMYEKYLVVKEHEMLTNDVHEFRKRRLQHWQRSFGSGERANAMISTLQALYEGADKGAELVRQEKEREARGSLLSVDNEDSSPPANTAPARPYQSGQSPPTSAQNGASSKGKIVK